MRLQVCVCVLTIERRHIYLLDNPVIIAASALRFIFLQAAWVTLRKEWKQNNPLSNTVIIQQQSKQELAVQKSPVSSRKKNI